MNTAHFSRDAVRILLAGVVLLEVRLDIVPVVVQDFHDRWRVQHHFHTPSTATEHTKKHTLLGIEIVNQPCRLKKLPGGKDGVGRQLEVQSYFLQLPIHQSNQLHDELILAKVVTGLENDLNDNWKKQNISTSNDVTGAGIRMSTVPVPKTEGVGCQSTK